MKLNDFDYKLPKELIAQNPAKPRDHSRLLVLDKKSGSIQHKRFFDLPDFLSPGDMIVMNNSKVFPARLIGNKKTGGKMEVFINHHINETKNSKKSCVWQCLIGGRGAKPDLKIVFEKKLNCKILKNNQNGTWDVEFNMGYDEMMKIVEKIGLIPLPPYIKRKQKKQTDKTNYQTIYANNRQIGSVAAPTAGLHFTPKLIKKLKSQGIKFEYITLHVGLGTFAPVKTYDITKHKMHAEWIEASKKTIDNIIQTKKAGKKIIAVGTTSTRTLEAVFQNLNPPKNLKPFKGYRGWVDIFIYPGYKFKVVDAIITNFHLPKSTLLMLVSAFTCTESSRNTGKTKIDHAYQEAIKQKYRFYSYGDAMLIK